MARQFKASTFFNKYLPAYMVNIRLDNIDNHYYSYELIDNSMDVVIKDFCESRMLIHLYAIISMYENKLVIPSGKCVDLSDISTNTFNILKRMPDALLLSFRTMSSAGQLTFNNELSSLHLSINTTTEQFEKTDFYSDFLFKDEIVKTTEILINAYIKNSSSKVGFIRHFDLTAGVRFYELAQLQKIFANADEISIIEEMFYDCYWYSNALFQDPHRLEIFKIIQNNERRLTNLHTQFDKLSLDVDESVLKRKPVKEIEKEKVVSEFVKHYSLYSDVKMRVDTMVKLSNNYELEHGIKIFSSYPYASRQYENQAYIPLMIKTPIKQINHEMIQQIDNMVDDFPHFHEIIQYISLSLKVRMSSDNILNFKHLLIVGDHGVGKNAFVRKLNTIFGYTGNSVNMTSIMAPFELGGMDAGWNAATPGFFFNAMLKNNVANPIIILDDLDKTTPNLNNGNVNTAVAELLEPASAKNYYENFFQTNIDMSNITVIGLANDIESVDRSVLDLFKVFKVERPTMTSVSSIVYSIYKELKHDKMYGLVDLDTVELNEIVAKFIMSKITSPRSMRKVIEQAVNDKLIETTKPTFSHDIDIGVDLPCDHVLKK